MPLAKFAKAAVGKLKERLVDIDGALTRRSILRDEKSSAKYFNDSEHIKEINKK